MKKWLPALLLIGAFIISLYVGATQIDNFWSALINPGSNEILWQIRFPRATAAVIVGAANAVVAAAEDEVEAGESRKVVPLPMLVTVM